MPILKTNAGETLNIALNKEKKMETEITKEVETGEGLDEITFSITLNEMPFEVIRVDTNGDIFVKGKKIVQDIEVYHGLITFLKGAGCYGKS